MTEIKYEIIKQIGVLSGPLVLRTSPPNATTEIKDATFDG